MIKQETIEINEKQFSIKELTVKQIIEIAQNGKAQSGLATLLNEDNISIVSVFTGVLQEIDIILEKCCSFGIEEMKELAPSEVKLLYEAFKRVNSDFLSLMEQVGIMASLQKIKDQMQLEFLKVLAD